LFPNIVIKGGVYVLRGGREGEKREAVVSGCAAL